MKYKKLIINTILFLAMSFCMVKSLYHYNIVDCGKVSGKSNDEITIKYGTKTELYLLVDFEKTGFKAQLVDPTTYFKYNKNDLVCFSVPDGKEHHYKMWSIIFILLALIWIIRASIFMAKKTMDNEIWR